MAGALRVAVLAARVVAGLLCGYAIATMCSLVPRWGASPLGVGLALLWIAAAALAWPISRGRITGRAFAGLLGGAAIGARLAALVFTGRGVPVGDPFIYLELARGLLAGHGMVETDIVTQVPMRALFPPAYPVMLAGLGAWLGLGRTALFLSNTALDLLAAWQIARLGRRLDAPAAGRAGAWLYATWPTFALAAPFASKEPLEAVLVLGIALMLLRIRRRPQPGWGHAAGLGVLGGVLALTQPGIAPLPVLLALAVIPTIGVRPVLLQALRAIPAALVVLGPWWARNMLVFGQFVPLTTTGGISLWIGNNAHASGNWMALPAAFVGMPELQQSRAAASLARGWIGDHPGGFLLLTLTKIVRASAVEQTSLVRLAAMHPAAGPATFQALFPPLQTALAVVLGAVALLLRRATSTRAALVPFGLTLACAVQLGGISAWFEFSERHRYVAMPFLFLLIGCGLSTLRQPALRPRVPRRVEA